MFWKVVEADLRARPCTKNNDNTMYTLNEEIAIYTNHNPLQFL